MRQINKPHKIATVLRVYKGKVQRWTYRPHIMANGKVELPFAIIPDMNDKISELETRIQKIEERNTRVENDKAWEGSWTRKILIVLFTYATIGLYLRFIVGVDPWINAIVPTIGFLLSTLTLPYFKKIWISKTRS